MSALQAQAPSVPTELAARLEVASEGSRELNIALGTALGLIDADLIYTYPDGTTGRRGNADPWPNWTDSIDRAVGLAERVLPGVRWGVAADDSGDGTYWASVRNPPPHLTPARYKLTREGKSAALALCAAVLAATAASSVGIAKR